MAPRALEADGKPKPWIGIDLDRCCRRVGPQKTSCIRLVPGCRPLSDDNLLDYDAGDGTPYGYGSIVTAVIATAFAVLFAIGLVRLFWVSKSFRASRFSVLIQDRFKNRREFQNR